jgi:hypothetical protein
MPFHHTMAGIVIAVLAAGTVVLVLAIVLATVVVIAAVHTEDRLKTLDGPPPGQLAWLARRVLGVPYRPRPSRAARPGPSHQPPYRESLGAGVRPHLSAGPGVWDPNSTAFPDHARGHDLVRARTE